MRRWLSPLVVFGAIAVAGSLFLALMVALAATRAPQGQVIPSTAVMHIIAAPTSTPILPTPTPVIESTPTATTQSELPPAPTNLSVGAYVQVSGTGGDGLRMRTDPSLAGQIIFIGVEAEVFQVLDGPRQGDGYTWWQLTDPYNKTHQGWAVANYLQVIQNP